MKSYTVVQGDCLSSIAFDNGFFWRTLWRHPLNGSLRQQRKDANVLYPGDVVTVPDLREKEESVALDQRHTFKLKGVPARLDLQFLLDGAPRSNEPFKLDVEGKITQGKTDDQGRVSATIKPNAKKGNITVGKGIEEWTYDLNLGALDPVDEISGFQARLSNLGYWCQVSGDMDDETRDALKLFQTDVGLPPTGDPDDATLDKLAAIHSGNP